MACAADDPDPGIFQQKWWLEAAGGPDLECVEVKWDGIVVAALYFVRTMHCGLRVLNLPPYTHTHGPILSLPESGPAKHMRNLCKVVSGLVTALPRHDRFHLFLDPDDISAFPFAMAGCTIEQDFTFRLSPVETVEARWLNLDQKTRNLIRSASTKLQVTDADDVEVLLDMISRAYSRRENRHKIGAFRRIAQATAARKQSRVLVARDDQGRDVASAMVVWDDRVLYYWQASRDPAIPLAGANNLLIWEAIGMAVSRGLIFDLDGYHTPSAARFNMKFGIPPVPRPSIVHSTTLGWLGQRVARLFTS